MGSTDPTAPIGEDASTCGHVVPARRCPVGPWVRTEPEVVGTTKWIPLKGHEPRYAAFPGLQFGPGVQLLAAATKLYGRFLEQAL